jgi:RHS repeat-associated protein
MGCPTNYDGRNYTWNRGKLTSITKGSLNQAGSLYESCAFTYDGYGRRKTKTYIYDSNSAATSDYSYRYDTDYTYDGSGRLIRETLTESMTYSCGGSITREFIYLYDDSGMIGVMYGTSLDNLQTYYFHRNLQGDVIAIYDANGNRKVEYAYDAFGNCEIIYGISHDLARRNPIRYRGYYLDRETGLYYLNARYYNPEWRRFISPDDTSYLDPEHPNGLNLYCYCNNDPVNYSDPSGHAPWWSWALSGLQMVVGSAMLWVPGMKTIGFSLAIGGAVGLMMTTLDPRLVQLLGGVNSVANGRGAASIGISLMSLGGWASLAGVGLFAVGIGTTIFGANEMVAAITGTNYIQRGLGMSDAAYALAYLELIL